MIKPLHAQKTPKRKVKTQNATKNFDNTTIVDRLKTVSRSDDSNQTGVVKPLNGIQTFPPATTVMYSRAPTCRCYFTVK